MKTTVLLLLACALLALGWLFFWPAEVETLAPASDTTPRSQAPAATEAVDIPREAAKPTNPSPERSALEQGRLFLVRILNGDTGEVIPNQELWYAPTTWNAGYDQESSVKSRGKKVQCDTEGFARIVGAPNQIILYARKDYLVGSRWLDRKSYQESGDDFATLELFPERVITLRVIDSTGIPASGVWVKATPITEDEQDSRWGLAAATNQAGQIVWKDFESTLRTAQREDGDQITGLRVEALVPGHDPVSLNISPLPSHGQSIELQIRPTGSLTVRLLDPNGELVPGKHIIELRLLKRNEETGEWDRGEPHGLTLEKGVGTISEVALGGYFELSVQGIWWPKLKTEVFGPTNEDRSVTRDISIEDSRIVWRGRAVDGSGLGLGGVRLNCEIKAGKKWISYFADTDSEGRFLSVLPEEYADRELSKAQIELRHHAPIDLLAQSPFPRGLLDVGDIVFDDQETLVSGELISTPEVVCRFMQLRIERRAPGTEKWVELDTTVEREGTKFSILGYLDAGDHRLVVKTWQRCHIPIDPIPFIPGQENLTIRLEAGHGFAVDAFVSGASSELASAPFHLLLRPITGDASTTDKSDGIRGFVADPGQEKKKRYSWAGLRGGIYNLEVWANDKETLLRTETDFEIPRPAGEPLVIEIDLRPELREYRLHMRTPSGIAPEQGTSTLFQKGNMLFSGQWITGEETDLLVIAPHGVFGLWILAGGYQPVWIESLDRDQDVVLTPSDLNLSIQLRQAGKLPEGVGLRIHIESQAEIHARWMGSDWNYDPTSIFLRLSAKGLPKKYWPKAVSEMLDLRTSTILTLHRPGSQTLRVELVPTIAAMRASFPKAKVWIDGVTPARFDVGATGETKSLQISIPPAAIEAALRRAGVK